MTDDNVILRAAVGSHAYGTATPFSDKDYMEVVIEPRAYITGLSDPDNLANHSHSNGEARSDVNTVDTTRYGLKKFAKLASAGNPNVLEFLFLPDYDVISPAGGLLLEYRDMFVSRSAGRKFLGFATGQIEAVKGMNNKRTNRPELEHTHGFDSKWLSHTFRIALEGIELMQTGHITLPLRPDDLELVMRIKNPQDGDYKFNKAQAISDGERILETLDTAYADSRLAEHANLTHINDLMHTLYTESWT